MTGFDVSDENVIVFDSDWQWRNSYQVYIEYFIPWGYKVDFPAAVLYQF